MFIGNITKKTEYQISYVMNLSHQPFYVGNRKKTDKDSRSKKKYTTNINQINLQAVCLTLD